MQLSKNVEIFSNNFIDNGSWQLSWHTSSTGSGLVASQAKNCGRNKGIKPKSF